jgi:hypothetical protein
MFNEAERFLTTKMSERVLNDEGYSSENHDGFFKEEIVITDKTISEEAVEKMDHRIKMGIRTHVFNRII